MADPFIAEIRIFTFNFAPRGWAFCDGRLLPLAQNTALFSLLGTFYGGDGQYNFALPDFQDRVPIHQGQGPGLSERSVGEVGGAETVALTPSEVPPHSHLVNCSTLTANKLTPAGNFPAGSLPATQRRYAAAPAASMVQMAAGGASIVGAPHENLQPHLALNFCIAMQGYYPPRQ